MTTETTPTLPNFHGKEKISPIRTAGTQPLQPLPVPLSVDQLLALPPLQWRVAGLIPTTGVGVIYGPPGEGKTFVALDLAFSIAVGGDFAGMKTQRGASLYFVCEGIRGLRDRVDGYTSARGCFDAPVGFQPAPINLFTSGPREIIECARAWQEKVAPPVGLVVIDTLSRAAGGMDENSGRDMGQVIQGADAIWRELNCFVLLVHHSGKDRRRGSRGHNSLLGALDFEAEVAAGKFTAQKVKDGATPPPIGFELVQMQLQSGRDTCLVRWAGQDQHGESGKLSGDLQKLVLSLAVELAKTNGRLGAGGAPASKPAFKKADLQEKFQALRGSRGAPSYFDRTLDPMLRRGVLHGNDAWLWFP